MSVISKLVFICGIYIYKYIYIYIYIGILYILYCTANFKMKYYRNHSNFDFVCLLVSLSLTIVYPAGVANSKPHILQILSKIIVLTGML